MEKKKVFKILAIIVVILLIGYLIISLLKYVKIHEINQKVNNQRDLNNYYYLSREFKETNNIFSECIETKVWYNGSKLKILRTINNIEDSLILIDYENNKQYYKDMKSGTITEREDGTDTDIPNKNGLHILRDNYIDSNNNIFIELLYSLNPTMSVKERNGYFVIDYKTHQDEYVRIFINKELGLPQSKIIEKNNTKTFSTYEIEKENVNEEDFKI